ncbi:chaperone protein dnaJ 11, chloroplastic-like [Juglans regia]|uniref:Chaperone protein dnaJ 11, chloroplastic-like n=2 Tax=Juglans regia TaxID=51240 RepID=A0A6P9ED32_JUGRE|nr:chaperone protein dnaJ 11, chloroplastic-like [Juglans regia]
MPGNATLHPLKPSFGSKLSHPNYKNQELLPGHACVKAPRRNITLCAATATESVGGSVRTVNSSSSSTSFSFSLTTIARRTFYQLLRVKETASQTEIKAAYRSLAKQYHPDAVHSSSDPDARGFIEIHNAYATLSDPVARAHYDLSIAASSAAAPARPYRYAAGFPSPTRRWESDQCW